MAFASDSASTFVLPARPVPRKHIRTTSQIEQAARVGVGGMQYTILRDPPWGADTPSSVLGDGRNNHHDNRVSDAPTVSSTYSDYATVPHDAMMTPEPLSLNNRNPYHAHPNQHITDDGPPMRQSRLPIFKQVRHMLNKPSPIVTSPDNVRWDEYSGELSENGKAPQVKPSTYVSPYQGLLKPSRDRGRPTQNAQASNRDLSPVSVLNEQDLSMHAGSSDVEHDISPVSPISRSSSFNDGGSSPIAANVRAHTAQYLTPPSTYAVRRKLVSTLTPITSSPAQSENTYPRSPSEKSNWSVAVAEEEEVTESQARDSRFSWTTYATSVNTGRHSTAEFSPPVSQTGFESSAPGSRFSWTTVNTATTGETRPGTAPRSNVPPLPVKLPESPQALRIDSGRGPPVQSILSRSRPVQRYENKDMSPPIRISTIAPHTPAMKRAIVQSPVSDTSMPGGSGKKLPLPPQLASPGSPVTHIQSLLVQEQDLERQRSNTLKGISELEKIEKASPLDVPFVTVRDAKRRLEEYRLRLSEVERDLRDVGIAISRVRRKDGQENGLWVRRVTG